MPKRPKSPEIEEDSRYFTVYQPYPLNANWILENDQKQCAMWAAECIGVNNLIAIHEKPKSRAMILLEVSRSFTDHACFLGEHRWSEFLKNPTAEQRPGITQVFHSFYARGRDAQKDGWKVIQIESSWFDDWEPGQGDIKQPYPDTYWCPTPTEDKTNKRLCRPLPVEQKPPPPRVHHPVVGSSVWVEKQVAGPPTEATLASAWSKNNSGKTAQSSPSEGNSPLGPPPASVENSWPVVAKPSSPATTTANLNTQNEKKSGPKGWGKAVPLQTFTGNASGSNGSTKKQWNRLFQTALPPGAKSPLAEEPPSGPVNAWAKPLKIPESHRARPSPRSSAPGSASNSPWAMSSPLDPGFANEGPKTTSWADAYEDTYGKENGNLGSPDAAGSSGNPVLDTSGPSSSSKDRRQENVPPKSSKGKKRKGRLAPEENLPDLRPNPAEGTYAAMNPTARQKQQPAPSADEDFHVDDDDPTNSLTDRWGNKKKTVRTVEDIYNEFMPDAIDDEMDDWSLPGDRFNAKEEMPDWNAPPPESNTEKAARDTRKVSGKKQHRDNASHHGPKSAPRDAEEVEGAWDKRRISFNNKGKGRSDEGSHSHWITSTSTDTVDWGAAANAENNIDNWGASAEGDADMNNWNQPSTGEDDQVGNDEDSGINPFDPSANQTANDAWANVEIVPGVLVDDGYDYAASAERERRRVAAKEKRDAAIKKKLDSLNLICPTHNIACKKGICKDMGKLLREEEKKIAKSFSEPRPIPEHVQHDIRMAPRRPRGSKRGPRVRNQVEPSTIGKMRAFEDEDQEEGEEDQHAATESNYNGWQTQSKASDW